jgi:hypothetical protein
VYEITYADMVRRTRLTEQEAEAIEKFESIFDDADFEWETGLPAISRRFGDATTRGAPVKQSPLFPNAVTASGAKYA